MLDSIQHTPPLSDTLICEGEFIEIDLSGVPYFVTWEDGDTIRQRTLSSSGSHTYSLSNEYCEADFSIDIAYLSEVSYAEVNLNLCRDSFTTWQDQQFFSPGVYFDTLRFASGCDSVITSIEVNHHPIDEIELDGNLLFCAGESTRIEVVSMHDNIIWSNGVEDSVVNFSIPGIYTLTGVDEYGCAWSDSVQVEELSAPEVITDNLLDTVFFSPLSLPVNYFGDISTYLWYPADALDCQNCPFPQLIDPVAEVYQITASNAAGCMDTGLVQVSFRELQIYVPTVIRPSSDVTVNTRLFAQSRYDMVYDLSVYDRWGGRLFAERGLTTNDHRQGWRPDFDTPPDVYVWLIRFYENGQEKTLTGEVTILN